MQGIEEEICQVFDLAGDYMDEARKDAILSAFTARCEHLKILSESQAPTDDIAQDVEHDTAQDYGLKMDRPLF